MSEIIREDTGSKRRYVIRRPEGEAELTLSVLSPERVIADHTYVPNALRGQGLADELLQALLDDARSLGFTIIPLCRFIAGQPQRHPEWAELLRKLSTGNTWEFEAKKPPVHNCIPVDMGRLPRTP